MTNSTSSIKIKLSKDILKFDIDYMIKSYFLCDTGQFLTDTGENAKEWTRVFFDSALSHTRRSEASEKKKKNTRVPFWTFSPVDKFRVFAYRLKSKQTSCLGPGASGLICSKISRILH